jgi:hypothetical protein
MYDWKEKFMKQSYMCMIKHGYCIRVRIKVETCSGLTVLNPFLFPEHGVALRTQLTAVYMAVKQAMGHTHWHGMLSKAVILLNDSTCPGSGIVKTLLQMGWEYIRQYSIIPVIVTSLGHC